MCVAGCGVYRDGRATRVPACEGEIGIDLVPFFISFVGLEKEKKYISVSLISM